MKESFGPTELERFRALIARRLGLHFDESKLEFVAEVLAGRVAATHAPAALYLQRLEGVESAAELRALALELTVNETYFFRNREQFQAFSELVLPARLAARAATRTLKLLSAGCASGEEPYSLALLLRERLPGPGWQISIRAVDVNVAVLAKAARGRYSSWSLRETPLEIQKRWFRRVGNEVALDDSVRASVMFQERNLTQEDPELWSPASYDAVFCRNVIMYLTHEAAQALIARIARALVPDGYLFLGHAETLRGLSNDFHLCHSHGTFYYQRKGESPPSSVSTLSQPSFEQGEAAPDLALSPMWIETVQRASERIEALAERSTAPLSPPATPGRATAAPEARASVELGLALELLKNERFADALARLADLPPDAARDPDALLLRAALLTHSGQLTAAVALCTELLQRDELSAGAHYLLALSHEGLGQRQTAVDHYQMAAYLDPSFAMPRLHLGLMARRAGEPELASRELSQALNLLRREDASRLLLFGGGFGRDALIALCRAELAAAGRT